MLSPFYILTFLTCVWAAPDYSSFACLGVCPPPLRGVRDLAIYQRLTWMELVILRLFLVGLYSAAHLVGWLDLRSAA